MFYEKELNFFLKLLESIHLSHHFIIKDEIHVDTLDQGLRSALHMEHEQATFFHDSIPYLEPNKIYKLRDSFTCNYIFMLLPDCPEKTCLAVGPYMDRDVARQASIHFATHHDVPPQFTRQLEHFFSIFPILIDDSALFALLNTFGEVIWGDLKNFTTEISEYEFTTERLPHFQDISYYFTSDPQISIQALEKRYSSESQLMQAVSQGLANKAEMILSSLYTASIAPKIGDSLRKIKNYSFVLNTLLRKAAEFGSVHPLHIDTLSTNYAIRIEALNSFENAQKLHREMVHKYCLLVKNHSLKGYSPLVQQVLTNIDIDLTADLSLKNQAKLLNVSAGHLSSLFTKEMGVTLTEYVNRKRTAYGILLLNTTSMKIQTIAQHCGIPDVNYFTKLFKKFYGKTPKEYREIISNFSS